MIRSVLILIFISLFYWSGNSQDTKRYTEEEIKSYSVFINAKLSLFKKDTIGAIQAYKSLFKTDQMPMAAFELSKIYALKTDFGNATKYGKKAFPFLENREGFLLHMLSVYQLSENQTAYLTILKQLSDQFPLNEGYFYKLVDTFIETKEYKKALKLLNTKENEKGIIEEVVKRKFDIFMSQKKHKKAEKQLLGIIEKYPNEVLYLYNLTSFYEQTGHASKNKKIYEKILLLNPFDENAVAVLNQAINSSSRNEISYLRSLIPIVENPNTPTDEVVKNLIPYIDQLNKKFDHEISNILLLLLDKFSKSHSSEAKAMSIYADLLYISGSLENSKKQYIKTLNFDKSVFSVWQQLLLTLDRLQDYENLLEYSNQAINYYPNQALPYLFNSLANAHLDHKKQSQNALEEASILLSYSDNYTKQLYKLVKAINYLKLENQNEALIILAEFEVNKHKLSFEILEKMSLIFSMLGDGTKQQIYKELSIKAGNNYSY